MATYTPNYRLKKPAQEDFFDVQDANGNMDTLDTQLYSLATALGKAADKPTLDALVNLIGRTNNTGGTTNAGTVMAKLNAIQTLFSTLPKGVVKSIQRGTTKETTVTIYKVDPAKCFVILNNSVLKTNSGMVSGTILSSLSSTRLSIYVNSAEGEKRTTSWQVIEFY